MIITLKNADFSQSNIGTLSTWRITRSLGAGAIYEGPTSVDKDAPLMATVIIANGYEIGAAGITITMGGIVLDKVVQGAIRDDDGLHYPIAIPNVTGNVVIKIPTVNINTGEEDEPDTPVTPDEPVDPDNGEDMDVYNLLNFNEQVPYLKTPSMTSAIPEVLSASTLKISNSGTGKNLIVDVPKPNLTIGDTYTIAFRVIAYTEDMVTAKVKPYIKWQGGTAFQVAVSAADDQEWKFKSFAAEEAQERLVIGCATNTELTTETSFTVDVRLYSGTLTALPAKEA